MRDSASINAISVKGQPMNREDEIASPWRYIQAETYATLCKSKAPTYSLEILNMPVIYPSCAETRAYKTYFSHLKSIGIGLAGEPFGAVIKTAQEPHLNSYLRLSEALFGHLNSVTELAFYAHGRLPMEYFGSAGTFRSLKRVDLRNLVVDDRLICFLADKAQQLESIVLGDCFACVRLTTTRTPPTWGDLFAGLVSSEPKNLTRFEIVHVVDMNITLSPSNIINMKSTEPFEMDIVGKVKEAMEEGRNLVFWYAMSKNSRSRANQARLLTMKAYLKGEDWGAWKASREAVEGNVRRKAHEARDSRKWD